ncbi:MAG TPA: alpha/beta hydrolase [Polyangiales bacterium]|nr:alpha/beta hydrolase [Polyangiales bacterium]
MKIGPWIAALGLLACGDDGNEPPDAPRDAAVDASSPIDAGAPDTSTPTPEAGVALLAWQAWGDAGYQRATLAAAPQQNVALVRRPATGARIGSLVWNPGGPGGSAIDALPDLIEGLGSEVLQRYDLVAMDPRGVGHSDPIVCHSKLQQLFGVDPAPDDEQEWAAVDTVAKQFADECASKYSPALLGAMRTQNVAADLELLRQQLGEDKLNFLGFSYGSALGAYYAASFPDKVGKLVLDGPFDLALDPFAGSLEQAKGFEQALANYFEWCNAERCAWANGNPAQAFAALQQQVETTPLPGDDRPCGPSELVQGVLTFLYAGEDGWEVISDDLLLATQGDGTGLVESMDIYLGRDFETGEYPNLTEANAAVNCVDDNPITFAQIRAQEAAFKAAAPIFGVPVLSHLAVCAHWPAQGMKGALPANVTSQPFLVVGTTQDPATPYAGAQAMVARLGPSARLFTFDGEGHTAYARGVACVDAVVEDYLLDGTLPAAGASCMDSAFALGVRLTRKPVIRR